MIKYFKWIMLTILIICLIITFVLFWDFVQKNEDDNVIQKEDSEISIVYGKKWRRIGLRYYENDKLVSENFELNDLRFMIFDDKYVEYCDMYGDVCEKYDYTYNDGSIFINSEDYFVTNGTYDIVFDENEIQLSMDIDNNYKVIYYFS